MFNSIKKGLMKEDQKEKKPSNATLGGMSEQQMRAQINSGRPSNALAQPQISEEIQNALNYSNPNKDKETVKISANSVDLLPELATVFSEGDTTSVIERLRKHLNENKGDVDLKFWYMLMDCYQVNDQKAEFDKVALSFAHKFATSPPSWFENEQEKKKGGLVGKNILILEPVFKQEHTLKFKEFLKSAKEENFSRINVSPCKFEQSEVAALNSLHKLFTDLRKYRVLSILMGDNNLINFCKTYINANPSNKALKQEYIQNEEICWLLLLEVLQWKGKQEEFENYALEYAMKFEISPPGWEDGGIMSVSGSNDTEEQKIQLDKNLNDNNIEELLNFIRKDFETMNQSEIDLSQVDRIDFSAAGSISHFIQELMMDEQNPKKVIFKYPNEMIRTLFEMVGVTEFVEIINRKR